MKKDIHPSYRDISIQCSCGNMLTVGSASEKAVLETEICSVCHPFYTGSSKLIDTAGRVEKFRARLAKKKK
jgi:large subunit ribosomal protein L31